MRRIWVGLLTLCTTTCFAGAGLARDCETPERQPATEKLIKLVEHDTNVKYELEQSIRLGQIINDDPHTNPVASLGDYYDFVDALVTYSPQNIRTGTLNGKTRVAMDGKNYCNWNILDLLAYSYFLVDRQLTTDPRGQIQFTSDKFGEWMRDVAEEWGRYLETPESAAHVPDFANDPNFGHWYCPPGPPDAPYPTFQAFFTRKLCEKDFPTGSREVEGFGEPRTVVSIGDSTSAGWWPISDDGRLVTTYDGVAQSGRVIKGKLYSDVHEFIAGGPDEHVIETFGSIDPEIFDGGTWTHQFLNVNDYHRLHVPVAGEIVYLKHLQSAVRMKSGWVEALGEGEVSYYDPRDTADWQFGQTRMVIGIDTGEYGIVVISPMGMAQVSGIDKRDWVVEGAMAEKGWEFANFAFGGS
ncbi:MAG: phosphatidylserine decarboxylase, partial [Thermoleophilia bacterium]|nr:phosphatidylserine decarboxylase [Thermoleophilia bacterium]